MKFEVKINSPTNTETKTKGLMFQAKIPKTIRKMSEEKSVKKSIVRDYMMTNISSLWPNGNRRNLMFEAKKKEKKIFKIMI